MGFSQAQKAESREKILNIAAKKVKTSGMASVAIAELMKEAGLTQGAFYGHFASRDDLILEAVKLARSKGAALLPVPEKSTGIISLEKIVDTYFSSFHLKRPGEGCVIASLAGEAKTAPNAVKDEVHEAYTDIVDRVAQALAGNDIQTRALAITSSMIGAMTIARTSTDTKLSQSILNAAKKMILQIAE